MHYDSKTDGRINLEQQKKRAKDLLKNARAGDLVSVQRFQNYHPEFKLGQGMAMDVLQLADSQLVIARENKFPSWSQMKAHIDQMERVRQTIEAKHPEVQDADLTTLHIRCGSDIQQNLKKAGFVGDFLDFSDPFCQGPVPTVTNLSEFIDLRSDFIAKAYEIQSQAAYDRIQSSYQKLQASTHYPRIALWFEHDSYDQLSLAYLLHHFRYELAPQQQLELICIDQFPGIQHFIGLGQLPPEAMPLLWSRRQIVTQQQLELCDRIWQSLTAPSPEALLAIVKTGTPELPKMAPALLRHLQELPWIEDGLSLTERCSLLILSEQSQVGEQLFSILTHQREPLPFLADKMYWYILQQLLGCSQPPLSIEPETAPLEWPQRRLQITTSGIALLKQEQHLQRLHPPHRWVGGVHLDRRKPHWQWNQEQLQVIHA